MSVQRRSRLAGIAFGLAIVSVACFVMIFVLVPIASLLPRQEQVTLAPVLTGTPLGASALLALAAVVTGHVSRRDNRVDWRGRSALIIGYGLLGLFALLLAGWWISMSLATRH